jgi:hypothetical protein
MFVFAFVCVGWTCNGAPPVAFGKAPPLSGGAVFGIVVAVFASMGLVGVGFYRVKYGTFPTVADSVDAVSHLSASGYNKVRRR